MSGGIWGVDRLRFATDAAGVGLWSWNVDTDRINLDDRAFDLWGVPRSASVTFEELSARIHPEDLDKVRAAFNATRARLGPYETDFRILHGEGIRWVSARGRGDDEGIDGSIMYGVFIDVSVRKLAEEAREMVVGEMHHRIKNIFSLTSALAGIASRTTSSKDEMAQDLNRRLIALSTAHDLIRPGSAAQSRAVELDDLFSVLLKPYLDNDAIKTRVEICVPKTSVGEHSASALAMVVHELATNAIKYGGLSSPTGKLAISGHTRSDEVEINWKETGGPRVEGAPQSTGFGTKMVLISVKNQLGGDVTYDWPQDGIAVSLKLNMARLGA